MCVAHHYVQPKFIHSSLASSRLHIIILVYFKMLSTKSIFNNHFEIFLQHCKYFLIDSIISAIEIFFFSFLVKTWKHCELIL